MSLSRKSCRGQLESIGVSLVTRPHQTLVATGRVMPAILARDGMLRMRRMLSIHLSKTRTGIGPRAGRVSRRQRLFRPVSVHSRLGATEIEIKRESSMKQCCNRDTGTSVSCSLIINGNSVHPSTTASEPRACSNVISSRMTRLLSGLNTRDSAGAYDAGHHPNWYHPEPLVGTARIPPPEPLRKSPWELPLCYARTGIAGSLTL